MKPAIDLGDNHFLLFAAYKNDPRVACRIEHLTLDGRKCVHWVPFNGRAWLNCFTNEKGWDVQQEDPLTLSPSVQCRACGDHGFVINGKWVKA
jgi:hypothetical protein